MPEASMIFALVSYDFGNVGHVDLTSTSPHDCRVYNYLTLTTQHHTSEDSHRLAPACSNSPYNAVTHARRPSSSLHLNLGGQTRAPQLSTSRQLGKDLNCEHNYT